MKVMSMFLISHLATASIISTNAVNTNDGIMNFIFSPVGLQIIVLLFFVINIISGYQKGFIQKILSLSSLVLSIIISSIFTPHLVTFFNEHTELPNNITQSFVNGFVKGLNIDKMTKETSNMGPLGKMLGLNQILNEENITNSIRDYVSKNITNVLITIISAIIIFIITLIILKIITHFFEYFNGIPFFGKINKILGGVLGFFIAAFILWIIFALIRCCEGFDAFDGLISSIKNGPMNNYIYENNLIYNFFSGLFFG